MSKNSDKNLKKIAIMYQVVMVAKEQSPMDVTYIKVFFKKIFTVFLYEYCF